MARKKQHNRGRGEGSIYQRASDKMWIGALDLGYAPDGRRLRPTVSAKTRPEVTEKLHALMREHYAGTLRMRSQQTLGEFLTDWLESMIHPHRAHNTYLAYRNCIDNYLVPQLGHVPLQDLTAQQVQRAMADMLKHVPRPQVRYVMRLGRIGLNTAVKWELIPRNPFLLVDLPRVRPRETVAWSPEEARVFLEAARGHRYEHLYVLLLACALRKSEALGLHWEDVDLDAGFLHVRTSLQSIEGVPTRVVPKSVKSARTLHLPHIALRALKSQRAACDPANPFVFTNEAGRPLSPNHVLRVFRALVEGAGLRRITLHGLRHTTATALLEAGVSVNTVSEMLGHSSVLITLSIYAHVLAKQRQDAASKVDEIYG